MCRCKLIGHIRQLYIMWTCYIYYVLAYKTVCPIPKLRLGFPWNVLIKVLELLFTTTIYFGTWKFVMMRNRKGIYDGWVGRSPPPPPREVYIKKMAFAAALPSLAAKRAEFAAGPWCRYKFRSPRRRRRATPYFIILLADLINTYL